MYQQELTHRFSFQIQHIKQPLTSVFPPNYVISSVILTAFLLLKQKLRRREPLDATRDEGTVHHVPAGADAHQRGEGRAVYQHAQLHLSRQLFFKTNIITDIIIQL